MRGLRIALVIILLALLGAIAAEFIDEDSFTPPRLAAAPLLVAEGEAPRLLLLTTHREIAAFLPNLLERAPRHRMHIDLWAFAAADFSPVWVRRVATVANPVQFRDPAISGALDGTVWLTAANGPHAFALADGAPRADAAAPPAASLRRPMEMTQYSDNFIRARGAVIDTTWFGFARADEVAALARDPTRALEAHKRYRLWTAKVVGQRDDFFRRVISEYRDFAPVAAGQELLHAGLLTHSPEGRRLAILLTNPTRLPVLHDALEDGILRRHLTCLRPDGTACWYARLGLTQVQGVAPLFAAAPAAQALFIVGLVKHPDAGEHEAAQAVVRVAMADGALRVINVGAIDPRALKAGLAR